MAQMGQSEPNVTPAQMVRAVCKRRFARVANHARADNLLCSLVLCVHGRES
ncbi:hypothetical protein U27_03208 [Candidatus Vecturithrix granuli]|uniref:Uncharacterized protein n=1 Tax=Vecturithrix granuli TaxID=1499967 RepID=A0A081BV91_VECG1|nr:hypothetical protein U27_03208 [Candidatus Vecturithrix granuli]